MRKIVLAAAAALFASQAGAANLVVNGDFSAGNTGFTSAYAYTPPGTDNNTTAQQYTVSNNAFDWNSRFQSYGDHTTGTGLYMIANGDDNPTMVWQQTLTGLTIGTTYIFSAFASNACCNAANASIPNSSPVLSVRANNVAFANYVVPISQAGVWSGFGGSFVAGASSVVLAIVDTNTAASGNDFGLDDISVTAVPEPSSWALMIGGLGLLGGTMRRRRTPVAAIA